MAQTLIDRSWLLAQSLLSRVQARDLETFAWCMQHKHRQLLCGISRVVSRSADGFYYPLLPLLLWAGAHPQAWSLTSALATGFAIERPLYLFLKRGCRRARPAQVLPNFESAIIPADHFSFPSGHTSAACVVATVVAGLFPVLFWPMCLWASGVGLSRVVLGVHFPTDVAAGAVMGGSLGALALACA